MPRPRRVSRPSDLPPELARAIASPVALTAVPMRVFAAPHRTAADAGVVSVVIELPLSGLGLTDQNGRLAGRIDRSARLVKIDVEGFEAEVLRGGRELFERHPPDAIVFEVNQRLPAGVVAPAPQVLHEMGYTFLSIPRCLFRMRLCRLPPGELPRMELGNDFLAVRRGAVGDEIVGLVRAS